MKSQRETMLKAQSLVGAKAPSEPAATVADCQQNPVDACKARHKTSWKLLFLVTQDFSFWAGFGTVALEALVAGADDWFMTCAEPFTDALTLGASRVLPL